MYTLFASRYDLDMKVDVSSQAKAHLGDKPFGLSGMTTEGYAAAGYGAVHFDISGAIPDLIIGRRKYLLRQELQKVDNFQNMAIIGTATFLLGFLLLSEPKIPLFTIPFLGV
jgi:hypothetical protein